MATSDTTVKSWVDIAHGAGLEFTGDELKAVIEESLGRKLTIDNAVREYLAARSKVGAGELSQKVLEKVAGTDGVVTTTQ